MEGAASGRPAAAARRTGENRRVSPRLPAPDRRAWSVSRERGSPATFHHRIVAVPAHRSVAILEVDRPALVLGSTQPESVVDRRALADAGVDLVRRRSGGGAVLLRPGEVRWLDVVVPREDPLWDDDVGRASHWLGRAWAAALGGAGLVAEVHEGPLVTTRWSRLVCFAGLGPGEVVVDGAKVVGIAQRRTREAARFQCALLVRWDPVATTSLLALDAGARAAAAADLAVAAVGVGDLASQVVADLLDRLPP